MKCIVLSDQSRGHGLKGQSGSSLYLEVEDRKILVNLGSDDAAFRNAESLGVDLSLVDTVVITGGLNTLGGGLSYLKNTDALKEVILAKDCFKPRTRTMGLIKKQVGLDASIVKNLEDKVKYIEEDYVVDTNITVLMAKNITENVDGNIASKQYRVGSESRNDNYDDEIILAVKEWNKLNVFAGSPRVGILNVVNYVDSIYKMPIHGFVAGFEMRRSIYSQANKPSIYQIEQMAQSMISQSVGTYYSLSTTGKNAFAFLSMWLDNRLLALKTGDQIEL